MVDPIEEDVLSRKRLQRYQEYQNLMDEVDSQSLTSSQPVGKIEGREVKTLTGVDSLIERVFAQSIKNRQEGT